MKFPVQIATRCAVAVVLLISLVSCSSPQLGSDVTAQGYWIGDRVSGSPRIVIDLGRQVVRYYKGGTLVGAAPVSSGREGHGTVTGTFRVTEKDADHRSSLYGSFVTPDGRIVESDVDVRSDVAPPGTRFLGASMRSFMRVHGAIGMHEGYLPGFPASHGCIRLPSRMAAIFFQATPVGTPVQIIGNAPDGHQETFLPVPHHLRPEDVVVVPKDEGTEHLPRAQVALGEPKPAPLPTPEPERVKVASVSTQTDKPSMFASLFGGGEEETVVKPAIVSSPGRTRYMGENKPQPAAAALAAPTPQPRYGQPTKPTVVASVSQPEPQVITYKPLQGLAAGSKTTAPTKTAPKPAKLKPGKPVLRPKKAPPTPPAPRGQTYFLPGYG